MEKLAVITGADGGMGTEITRAVAQAGYRVVMACYHPEKGRGVCERLKAEMGNEALEVMREAREAMLEALDEGLDPEEVFADITGLEPDYIWSVL